MSKTLGSFKLNVEEGSFTNCEIIVLLGENGTGKTTLVRLLAGDKKCEPDEKEFDVTIKLIIDKEYKIYLKNKE
jgi:ATP-binding cassette subfamily E protein 1